MQSAKVLVVEDDPRIREELCGVLRQAGYDVQTAEDGERALQLAPEADLVLLNLGLPKLSGLEVLQRLREAGRYVPVIVVSGDAEHRKEAEQYKIVDFITKPIKPRDLMDRVARYLRVGDNMDSISGYTQTFKDVVDKETKSRS